MKPADRRAGYWNRERETMSAGARERYQAGWLGALLEHAWRHAPGVRRRLEQAGLSPKNFRSTDDLARLPVIKKSAMPDLQKADPPFGGFCTVPLAKIRKIFVSPGPIFEPMGPEVSAFHAETALFAGGFRPGDIVINTFAYALTPAAHELDEAVTQVCDPTSGEPLPHGQIGELVATVNNRTYPMIRFGTGDLTIVTDEPCPCGRTSARMLGWRGRADEVTKVRGLFIHPRQVDEIVARVKAVGRSQVVVGREGHNDTLTLRVELGAGADTHAVAAALEAAIRDVMKLRGIVAVVAAGTIPENAKKISDERKWD